MTRVFFALKRPQNRFKYNTGSLSRNRHAYLLTNRLFTTCKIVVIGERLQTRTLTVSERSVLFPVVHMGTATARTGYGISGLFRVETLVNLGNLCTLNLQLKMFRNIRSKSILSRFDV